MGGVLPVIVEKDFWVCWALDHLFADFPHRLIFKGGTSLSKVFGLIERFSEDIDLAFDRRELGFVDDRDPEKPDLSATQRRRRVQELRAACHELIATELLPTTREWTAGLDDAEIDVEADGETVTFSYPRALDAGDYAGLSYVRPSVRLEFGATSAHDPAITREVRSYAAEHYPALFQRSGSPVRALAPERTFWEKVTLLHVEPDRPQASRECSWQRTSRHLYDIFTLADRGVSETVTQRLDLLVRVCAYKSVYLASGWADYDSALTPAIRIRPCGDFERAMRTDYSDMQQMFFGEAPQWDEMLSGLDRLEARIRTVLG